MPKQTWSHLKHYSSLLATVQSMRLTWTIVKCWLLPPIRLKSCRLLLLLLLLLLHCRFAALECRRDGTARAGLFQTVRKAQSGRLHTSCAVD